MSAMKINRLLIFGGNGFVGQAIAKRALQNGLKVVALSRNGLPHDIQHDLDKTPNFKENLTWAKADITKGEEEEWIKKYLNKEEAFTTSVVSCVGVFSKSNEIMKSVNGDANADLIRICKENGAKRFVYISAYEVENEITIPFITGYFQGKRIAEQAVQKFFPGTHGTILHPGMIYGTRIQNGLVIPLSVIGAPLEFIMNLPGFNQLRKIPILGKVTCSPPVSVHSVANCVVKAATGQLDEQYNYDNDVLNDNNEANPEFKQHHSAIVLEIPQIAACRP